MSTTASRIQQAALDAIRPPAQVAPPGNYTPTLIVGLGGTGIRTLRFLKKYLKDKTEQNIEILGIECDASETDKFPELPALIHKEELEFLQSGPADATILGAVRQTDDYLLGYLPDTHGTRSNIHTEVRNTMRRQRGAGQRRRVGRVFFEANCEGGASLISVIKKKKEKLRGMNTRMDLTARGYNFLPHASVYVVSSLAGGTGAGGLLSALALLRNVFNAPGDTITLVGVLPGETLDAKLTDRYIEEPATRANAIALLRELQAARITQFPEYSFELSDMNKQEARTTSLADSVYLLDHELYDGTPVPDYEDICHTAALFLYSFVGTGVGSADSAGEVNLTTTAEALGDGIPRCFDSIGLSVLTYPLEDLMEYCGRNAFRVWAEKWLKQKADAGVAQNKARELGLMLGLTNAETFVERFKGAIDMGTPGFLQDEHQRKEAIKTESDEGLKTLAAQAQNSLENQLRLAETILDDSIDKTAAALCGTVREEALKFLDISAAQAQENVKVLLKTAETCKLLLSSSLQDTEADITELETKTIPNKERKLWLPGNWFGNRDKYVAEINRWFELKLRRAVGPHLLESIEKIIGEIKAVASDLETVHKELAATVVENVKDLAEFDTDNTSSEGLMVYAMRCDQFKDFIKDVALPELTILGLQTLTCDAIIDAVICKSCGGYVEKIDRLHLPNDIAQRIAGNNGMDPLLNAVKAVNDASQPRIRLKDNLPQPHEMSPRKYVVGNAVSPQTMTRFTARTATANITPVTKFADRHRMIVVETFHNFGAAHWEGFEVANGHYEKEPWWRHVLPDAQVKALPEFIMKPKAATSKPSEEGAKPPGMA